MAWMRLRGQAAEGGCQKRLRMPVVGKAVGEVWWLQNGWWVVTKRLMDGYKTVDGWLQNG